MEAGSRQDTAYIKMAEQQLHRWCLAGDEPEGTLWDLLCDTAGVDPELFAQMVRYQRSRGNPVRAQWQHHNPHISAAERIEAAS